MALNGYVLEDKAAWQWAERFGAGLPITARQALAYGYQRVNGRIDKGAYMLPALTGRDLTFTAGGQTQQSALQLPTALLVTSLFGRVYLDDVNDDSSMLAVQVQLPNLQGLLLGDPGFWLNFQIFAENATGLPLPLPWLLFPSDQTTLTMQSAAALAGNATATLAFQGAWIYGLI